MTSKQEQSLIKKLQSVKNQLEGKTPLVSYNEYNEIKELQEEISYLLNCLIQCDRRS